MNDEKFFQDVRRIFGRALTQRNVDSLNLILAEADRRGVSNDWLAYILATAHGESAFDYARQENMNYSAARIAQVWPRLASRAQELAGQPKRLANAAYANRNGNGNEDSGDGWRFRGQGFVQITGRANYRKFGIEDAPARALERNTSTRILFDGMIRGMFTGRRLADFEVPGGFDFVEARRIVNGTFEAARYAAWAHEYQGAIERAGRRGGVSKPESGGWLRWIINLFVGARK